MGRRILWGEGALWEGGEGREHCEVGGGRGREHC